MGLRGESMSTFAGGLGRADFSAASVLGGLTEGVLVGGLLPPLVNRVVRATGLASGLGLVVVRGLVAAVLIFIVRALLRSLMT